MCEVQYMGQKNVGDVGHNWARCHLLSGHPLLFIFYPSKRMSCKLHDSFRSY